MSEAPVAPPPATPQGYPLPTHPVRLTPLLLVANLIIFALMTLSGGSTNTCTLLLFGAKFNVLILSGEWWRLFTPIFLHIGITHLLFNEYALWIFGNEVERLFGTARFALIYVIAGLFGSVASFAFSSALSAGASGAIFGIIGALTAFYLRNRDRFGEMGRQQLSSLVAVIVINLVFGLTVPGIDNLGHMGGLAGGFFLGYALSPVYGLQLSMRAALGMRVIDRNPLPRSLWAALIAVALLVGATYGASLVAPFDRTDFVAADICLR